MKTEVAPEFQNALHYLEMDREGSGLRWVADLEQYQDEPNIYLALERAKFFGATAVYFRFFPDGDERPPKPQIYIYALDKLDDSKKESPGAIHKRLWNAGVVPFCFIYRPSEILIYNCSNIPLPNEDGSDFITSPHETIKLAGDFQEQLAQYSARKIDSGLFWDSGPGKAFEYEKGAYAQLLQQLQKAKQNVIAQVGAEHAKLVKKLLMMLILIKYLEERKDKNDKAALNPKFYKHINPKASTLSEILNKPEDFIGLLNELSTERHFNGQIFELSEDEKATVRTFDLGVFKAFVEGQMEIFGNPEGIGQMTIWRLYSFDYLPIELISHIYEDFLIDESDKSKPGVVYTPPSLVQLLVDRCMPLSQPKEQFKVLDPACGSGIFLVGAFKRMIQWWRMRNHWQHPTKADIDTLKKLLVENIYGCDIEEEAVRLTYFSLSLALLDALSPREIWENVHFNNLIGSNLFGKDFFQKILEDSLPDDFDLVIGNPPFQSELTDSAINVDAEMKAKNFNRPKVPDKQVALLFLEQSQKLLRERGITCLLLPAGPLLYNNRIHPFKQYLFRQSNFKEIYDFTPLRGKLFKSSNKRVKKPAAIAALTENINPDENPVYHLIFRNTRASGEKIEFEIDHYDIHEVPYQEALSSPKVWQANFMGGGRLRRLVERIASLPSLKEYLDRMVEKRNWRVGEGWIEDKNSDPIKRIRSLQSKINRSKEEDDELEKLVDKHSAEWITGYPFVVTGDFNEEGINKTETCGVEYFYRSAKNNKEIFQPPHLLMKESVKGEKIPVALSNEYLTFKDKIIGIHASESDYSALEMLWNYLGSFDKVPLMWLIGGQVITSREGVPLKNDIMSLPDPSQDFEIDPIERTLLYDIVNYYVDFRKKGEASKVLHSPTSNELNAFGEYYCRILNSIYDNFKPLDPVMGNDFIAYPFVLGDEPEIEIPDSIEGIEATLAKLLQHKASPNLWINRILKVYHKNVIFLYKPNQKRYWLRSIAIRDADETIVDLFNQGK